MAAIGTLNPGSSGVASLLDTSRAATGDEQEAGTSLLATPTLVEGIKVSLSGAAIEKSAGAGGDNRDIEESGLPENIQQLLKMIRQLQQQIAEKNARIKAVMADKTLSTEVKLAKLAALKGAIAALNNGLITANLSLSKVMNQSNLTPEQTMKTAALLMKN
ncbi:MULTISPECIES: hypothetical protein [Pseudomonas]|uniref:hypothetical protein n=1 Tax=Pseudomonas TaxID=286 RepID=UPI000D46FA5F|nr:MULTISPECIES: hypothetical protein [Pseudomonas]PTT70031.1 hypothetical protein DBR26_10465 [Pseudomonas sp. HMWF007]PTT80792.1 hypothetical protein DBR29_28560 [Pseudomonas sp. HMWF005]RON66029.1 hypothetical protein BK669_05105 [Pseudomonas fluorescens]MDZ3825733.1 hypothetical protein [Pseudomonas monsensis]PTS96152.1 hypothetical protein DBR24_20100 [Pseudomonas sp. HMWF006]